MSPFPLRGLKGLWWEPEQYLGWPAFLAGAGYDFFMLCYTFCPETGLRWRQPLRDAELRVIKTLADDCTTHGLTLCLALHPLIGGQAWSPEAAGVRFHPTSGRGWFTRYWQTRRPGETLQADQPIRYGSDDDLGLTIEKCRQVAALGVERIALCLDDVEPGLTPAGFPSLAAAHVWLANGLREAIGPAQRLQVVPTYYWTDGARDQDAYTAELAAGLTSDIDVFWTGRVVRDHDVTAEKAREAAGLFGRKPIVWLNYASNDSFRFMLQLPPDRPPAPDLAPETAGLLLNSTRQVRLARLDALVIGAYLADPTGYDHAVALQQAARSLVGDAAAPPLIEIVNAWAAVPDVRTLTSDLESGGRPFLDVLLARLRPALATIDRAMPELDATLTDRGLWDELSAGVARLRLLVDALELQGRLAAADPETACDAEAVLMLRPARTAAGTPAARS